MLSAVLCLVSLSLVSSDVTKLPDTSGIDFVLTEKLGVDKFFSLWLVFNNGDVKTSVVLSSTAENGEIEVPYKPPKYTYSSPMASLVLSDSSQLRADDFEKLPDQIMYPYAEPYDLQKHFLERVQGKIDPNPPFSSRPSPVNSPIKIFLSLAWFLLCEDVLQKTCGWRRPITATSLHAHHPSPLRSSIPLSKVLNKKVTHTRVSGHASFKSAAHRGPARPCPADEVAPVIRGKRVTLLYEPFTIFAPENGNETLPPAEEGLLTHPDLVKRLLLDHIVLGVKIDLQLSSELTFSTLGGRTVQVQTVNGTLYANGARVLQQRVEVPHGILVILDNYLFPEDMDVTNMTSTPSVVGDSMTGESLVKVTAEAAAENNDVAVETTAPPVKNSTGGFLESVTQVLSFLKSGVKVFRQFLAKSNVSHLLMDGDEYTVFVPTDHAFQRWHPIDWGFYPFSVPEFTETIIVNHFVKGNLHQDSIKDGQTAMTLGGQEITFARKSNGGSSPGVLTVNGVQVVKGDTPVSDGNMMFLGEVLFVDDEIVKKLQQSNRDKETAPLLAFPWMRSQFLSHAFLMLEKDPDRFTHITRFLNLADLAPHIAGKALGYLRGVLWSQTSSQLVEDLHFIFLEVQITKSPQSSSGESLMLYFRRARAYHPRALKRAKAYHPRATKRARAYRPRAFKRARAYRPRVFKRARAYHPKAFKRAGAYHPRAFKRAKGYHPKVFKRARAYRPKAFNRARAYRPRPIKSARAYHLKTFRRAGVYCPKAFKRTRAYHLRAFKKARAYGPRAVKRVRAYRYTFFVPTDKAFEKAELSTRPDNFLSKGEGLQILLNHFVKGRLYSKDLTEGKQLHTLGDKVISVGNNDGGVMVNNANILESEIFVYNLGTMYYIDRVLFVDKIQPTESNPLLEVAHEWTTEIPDDVEGIPSEIADERGGLPDLLEEEEQGYNSTAHYHEENDLEDEPEEYDDINYNHPETISHKINSTGLIQDDPEDYDVNVTTTIRPPR
uniref:FAS1 domain-containing protein n=1 Tax=Timema bartmani TaxID=61472 RepID=A0A7R9I2I5_9NEOP|nr:unnamed protein product [Timema bartmani]